MRNSAHTLKRKLLVASISVLVLAVVLTTDTPAARAQDVDDERVMERIGRGRASYRVYCRSCHGNQARGDGIVADVLKIPPSDLTRISARREGEFPFEEIRELIDGRKDVQGHGNRDMPIWGDAFKVATDTQDDAVVAEKITQLVYFLRSIQETGE
ncbi:MAG: cytochrome c [bacterium]|nr:cytochrome c [bacterium]